VRIQSALRRFSYITAIIVPDCAKRALVGEFAGFLLQNRSFSFAGGILNLEEVLEFYTNRQVFLQVLVRI